MAGEKRYWKKAPHAVNNHVIKIVRALKAAKIIPKLNILIRRLYACAQLISCAVPFDFTSTLLSH